MISYPYEGQEEHHWIPQRISQAHLLIMLSLSTPNLIIFQIVELLAIRLEGTNFISFNFSYFFSAAGHWNKQQRGKPGLECA